MSPHRLLVKSQIAAYTRSDGTFVAAHTDKRQKKAVEPHQVYSMLADADDDGGQAAVVARAKEIHQDHPHLRDAISTAIKDLGHKVPDELTQEKGVAEKGQQAAEADDAPENLGKYHRFTVGKNPDNGVGYMMFAADYEKVSGGTYGKNHHTFDPSDVNEVEVIDSQSDEFKTAVKSALDEHADHLDDFDVGSDTEQLIADLSPDDIVDTAKLWDDPAFVGFIYENVMQPNDWSVVTTPDGAIVFNAEAVKSHGNLNKSFVQLLVKAGEFKHSGGFALYGNPPRWHKIHAHKPAPKGAPVAHDPQAVSASSFGMPADQVAQLKLPDTNTNAATFNKQVDKLVGFAAEGNAAAILGAKFGVNTYAKAAAKLANYLLQQMGVKEHVVTPGQDAGTHAAVQAPPAQVEPQAQTQDVAPEPPQAPAEPEPKAEPAPVPAPNTVTMPEFAEGKTKTGVKAYYEKVAAKLLAAAGDASALEQIKADGLKPNAKTGKVGNTWAGKTENSKLLIAMHDKLLAQAGGQTQAAPAVEPEPAAAPEPVPAQATAPAPAPEAAAPAPVAAPVADATAKLDMIPWDKLELHHTNKNAKSHNKQIAKIKAMAYAGDIAGLEAFKAGSNTYGKQQNKVAQTALAALKESGGTVEAPAPVAAPVPQPEPVSAPAEPAAPAAEAPASAGPQKPDVSPSVTWQQAVDEIEAAIAAGDTFTLETYVANTQGLGAPGAKATHDYAVAGLAHLGVAQPEAAAVEQGPKDGDTKPGANGGTLVFKDGRWHKVVAADEHGEVPPALAPVDEAAPTYGALTPSEVAALAEGVKTGSHNLAKIKVFAVAGDAAGLKAYHDSLPQHWEATKELSLKVLDAMAQAEAKAEPQAPTYGALAPSAVIALGKGYKTSAGNKAKIKAFAVAGDGAGLHAFHESLPSSLHVSKKLALEVLEAMAQSQVEPKAPKEPKAAKKPASPTAAAPVAPVTAGIPSIDGWTQTGPQGGSNPGGKFKDPDGHEWYCKFPPDEEHARAEVLSAKLYEAAGLKAQDAKLIVKDGKIGIASRWVDVHKGSASELQNTPGALSGFVVDAWLANWDVVGMGYDNLQIGSNGRAMRVDAGGSLMYRAQGAKKPFGATVDEIDTMRDAAKNSYAASVFGNMTAADMTASAKKVLGISDDAIFDLVMEHGPGGAEDKAKLIETLLARKDDIAKRFPKAVPKAKPKAKPDPSKLKVDASQLPKPHDFHNWKGAGQGLSSKAHVNDANAKAEADLLAEALKGDLPSLKDYHYEALDKDTGAVLGKKPISEHPSNHVKTYWSDLVSALSFIAYPPEALKTFKAVIATSVAKVSEAFKSAKYGTTTKAVEANSRLAFWIALGQTKPAINLLAPNASLEFQSSPTGQPVITPAMQAEAKAAYAALTPDRPVKRFINGIQSSGSYNDNFRDGRMVTTDGWDAAKMALDAYDYATEKPEGFELYKWISFPGDMGKQMLAAPPGTVFQNPGSMCCSTGATGTAGFGADRIRIRYAKGAKAVDSYGSGSFPGEKEITTLPGQRFVILKCEKVMCPIKGKERIELDVLMLPPDPTYLAELETMKGKHGGK